MTEDQTYRAMIVLAGIALLLLGAVVFLAGVLLFTVAVTS